MGSVKTNIGHPEQAAGLAGLIKTALALKHARIPPSLHFATPNPNIDFANSPFFVNTALRDWPLDGHARRAAVNSLGIGDQRLRRAGRATAPVTGAGRCGQVVACADVVGEDGRGAGRAGQAPTVLREQPDLCVADVCFTSNLSRSQFGHRLAVTGSSASELVAKLDRPWPRRAR